MSAKRKTKTWICRSCGWVNHPEIGYKSFRNRTICRQCRTPKGAKPRNVAVIITHIDRRYDLIVGAQETTGVRTWPDGTAW